MSLNWILFIRSVLLWSVVRKNYCFLVEVKRHKRLGNFCFLQGWQSCNNEEERVKTFCCLLSHREAPITRWFIGLQFETKGKVVLLNISVYAIHTNWRVTCTCPCCKGTVAVQCTWENQAFFYWIISSLCCIHRKCKDRFDRSNSDVYKYWYVMLFILTNPVAYTEVGT